ncbi:helix-turn-helix domain-containing protein [Sphingomonas sp. PB4P5]|uniref:helix-turn-helix domain-containing protein n=1 Tax=Parasphingomonas puruogangriensis TaxID=3096155 RepID=UPI003FA68B87
MLEKKIGVSLPSRRTVTVKECCALCGISRSTAYKWFAGGMLTSFTVGRKRFVSLASIDALLGGAHDGEVC